MALIIDDGTFEVGNSLGTIDEADAYHLLRGNTAWATAESADKESAMIRSFDFLSVQPWSSTAFDNGIPIKVKQAQFVGALKELAGSGSLQPDAKSGIKKESIAGAIEKEYFEGGDVTIYSAVENLIQPYTRVAGRKVKMVRG